MKPITDLELSILSVILALHEQAYTENLFQNLLSVPGLSARGDLYRHVDDLEDTGMISANLIAGDPIAGIPTRRYYKLTGEGKRVLDAAGKRVIRSVSVTANPGNEAVPSPI